MINTLKKNWAWRQSELFRINTKTELLSLMYVAKQNIWQDTLKIP